ncbi:MAG: sigma-70 family RNA polymerase sigma factor [Lachnospiraceae bacterium]|nr:sigma-70 family RNA polymerase sigma factor [Lachnospiraceae bacterium]
MTPKECERIYNEAYRAVYWTAIALLKNEADAEDVVQDTFVTLLESYDTLQDKTKVVPWLKKICARKCLNLLSRTKTGAVEQEFFDDIEYVPEDFLPESVALSEERRKIIMDIITKALSEDVRRTIILFYFDDMSTKEIAEAMGIPQGTVLWRLGFARMKIKKEVEKYEKETNTKLYTVALPFLTLLFMKEAELVPFRPMSPSLVELSASKEVASAAGSSVASGVIKKGTGIVMKKFIISFLGITVLGAAIAGAIILMNRDKDSGRGKKGRDGKDTVISNSDPEVDPNADPDANAQGDPSANPSGQGGSDDPLTLPTPTAVPTIDVARYDWESVFRWEENEIVGFNYPLDEAMKNTGILVIPARCEGIESNAFGEQSWVKEVRFEAPEKITLINNNSMSELPHLHSLVMPPNADVLTRDVTIIRATVPFTGTAPTIMTKLHNLVLPNGEVPYQLMECLANCDISSPKNNQVYMEAIFAPENFSVRLNEKIGWQIFAKYTREFYEANWEAIYKVAGEPTRYAYKPCKVYVVKGSWADVHFDEWTAGDLIQKEYWDGVNYTFVEYDPLWDVRDITVKIGKASAGFYGVEDKWRMVAYNENDERIFDGVISPDAFEALYREVSALLEGGNFRETLFAQNGISIGGFGDDPNRTYTCDDPAILQALIDKYVK